MAHSISRRGFVSAAGTAAVATAAMSSVALADEAASDAAETARAVSDWGVEYPWAAEPPAIDDADVEEQIEADVVVCGLGVAGTAAFRAAAEEGVKVVAIEKAEGPQCRSSQYCYVNGSHREDLSLLEVDVDEVCEDEWKSSGLYADYAIIRKFVKNEAEVFDWWANGDSEIYWQQPGDDTDMAAMMDPNAEVEHPYMVFSMGSGNVAYETEPQVAYPTLVAFSNHQHVLDENCARAQEAGGTVYFGHFGEQLICDEDGRVTGIYARNAETGKYKKITSKNGVVMATGGCEGDRDIARVFYPAMVEYNNLSCWPNFDIEGKPTNSGDGYRMGWWAGAAFSTFMAPMCHVMGGPNDMANMATSMGITTPHLRLNYNGVRFMNEDANCSDTEVAVERQPQTKAFLICDSHLDEQAKTDAAGSTYTCAVLDEQVDGETIFKADTLEELFESIPGMDVEQALASVEHYNELCAAGYDEDFCKQSKYLWPVQDGPFYASRMGIGLCLTTMGGLYSDNEARVYNNDKHVIAGLYACGNIQGNRFAVKYPFKLSGASHAMAMYYGYVAGKNAAAGL